MSAFDIPPLRHNAPAWYYCPNPLRCSAPTCAPTSFPGVKGARAYVFGGGDWCDPERFMRSPPAMTWRERALRAAAVYPCTADRVISICTYGQAETEYVPTYAPACDLYVQHLHPARVLQLCGRCVP